MNFPIGSCNTKREWGKLFPLGNTYSPVPLQHAISKLRKIGVCFILSRLVVHSIRLFEAFRVLSCPSPSFRTAFFFCKFNCRRLLRGCWYSRPTWALWTPLSPARPYLMMHHAASDKEEQVKQENHRSSVTFLLWFSYTSASPRTLLNRLKPESKSCLWFSCIFLENLWFKTFRRNDLR